MGPVVPEDERIGSQIGLNGSCPDGEPEWSGCGCAGDPGDRYSGTGRRCGDAARQGGCEEVTLGADRGYDVGGVKRLREMKVAQNDSHRSSAVDARTTRHEGYIISSESGSEWRRFSADQNGGAATQDEIPGTGANGLDVHVRVGSIQLGTDEKPSSCNYIEEVCLEAGNRPPGRAKTPGNPRSEIKIGDWIPVTRFMLQSFLPTGRF